MSSGFHHFAADANEGNRYVRWAHDQGGNGYGIQCGLLRLNLRA